MKYTKVRLLNRAKAGHLKALGNQWLFTWVRDGHYFVARADGVLHEIDPETETFIRVGTNRQVAIAN
jgi:hypothetical protein